MTAEYSGFTEDDLRKIEFENALELFPGFDQCGKGA
jgi:hypothetical protein